MNQATQNASNAAPAEARETFEQMSARLDIERAANIAKAKAMGFTLQGIKVLKMASTDSVCFEANILREGKKWGYATDDGNGGMIDIHPASVAGAAHDDRDGDLYKMLEDFCGHEVEAHESQQWIARNAKAFQKKGATFVLVYVVGDRNEIMASFKPTLAEAKAEATKQQKLTAGTEPTQVFDFSGTAAKALADVNAARTQKWQHKVARDYATKGFKAVVFFITDKGGMSARAFRSVDDAKVFKSTAKNAELFSL